MVKALYTPILILTLAIFLNGCTDPFTRARQILEQNPKEALKLLNEAEKDPKGCKECPLYKSLAFEKMDDLNAAIQELEKYTREHPDELDPQFKLYDLYHREFLKINDEKQKYAIAEKAMHLESKFKIPDGFGATFLQQYLLEQGQKELKQGNIGQAIGYFNKLMKVYTSKSKKATLAKKIDRLLVQHFNKLFSNRISVIKQELSKANLLNHGFIELKNKITVPSPKQDPRFDPNSSTYKTMLNVKACLPLRAQLDKVVTIYYRHTPVKLTPYNKKIGDKLFRLIFPMAKAGPAVYVKPGTKLVGKPYICILKVKPESLLKYLYLLWDIKNRSTKHNKNKGLKKTTNKPIQKKNNNKK